MSMYLIWILGSKLIRSNNQSRATLLGECAYARCPHHRSTTTNTAQPQRVGALLPMPSCLGIGRHSSGSRQGHSRYTGERTTGRPWVAHTNAQRAKRTCHDAYSRQSNTRVFRQTNSVSPGNMSHCRASSLYDHLDHCFVVFKHIQQSFLM